MLLQNSSQVAAGVTGGVLGDFLWSAGNQDLTTLVTAFGTEIDDPVAATDHVKVVLDADCLLYTSPSPRDMRRSRMPSSA